MDQTPNTDSGDARSYGYCAAMYPLLVTALIGYSDGRTSCLIIFARRRHFLLPPEANMACVAKEMNNQRTYVTVTSADICRTRVLVEPLSRDNCFNCSPEAKHSVGRIMEILYGAKTVFTRSAITPPKVNQLGWSLEQCEPIVVGWPW